MERLNSSLSWELLLLADYPCHFNIELHSLSFLASSIFETNEVLIKGLNKTFNHLNINFPMSED